MIDVALVSLLKENAGCDDRIYSGGEKVETIHGLPKVVYTFINGPRLYTDDGNTGMVKGRYQLDIYASKPSEARGVADRIRIALGGFKGTQDDTRIDRIYFPGENDRVIAPQQSIGQSGTAARFMQDVLIDYREPLTIGA